MSVATAPFTESNSNPLDILEEIVGANEWPHDRASDEELLAEVSGRWCDYRMFFVWRQDLHALYFTSALDMKVSSEKRRNINDLLATINERMWFGHFEICSDSGIPMFRHTLLTRGVTHLTVEQLEDLVDIAVTECERFYPAFQYVLWAGYEPEQAIEATMLDPVGEA